MSISGTVGYDHIFDFTASGWPTLRALTLEEKAQRDAEIAEDQRRRAEWEAERLEREREMQAQWEAEQMRQRAHLAECDAAFPVAGVSGEFTEHEGNIRLDVWPTDPTDIWPKRVTFSEGHCSFCKTDTIVLEIDNSWGEYTAHTICNSCLSEITAVFQAKVQP